MLSATAISHAFAQLPVLERVDLAISPRELVGLTGPSGAGKSTLGRILAGQLRPDAGRVEIDGAPLSLRAGQACAVQYAPQLSELSVDPRWRVSQILRNGGDPDPEALEIVGIRPEWANRFSAELSGGELTRVSLARLVLPSTQYLICDEITAPLDALSSEDMLSALKRLAARGLGILLISHNLKLLNRHVEKRYQLHSEECQGRRSKYNSEYCALENCAASDPGPIPSCNLPAKRT